MPSSFSADLSVYLQHRDGASLCISACCSGKEPIWEMVRWDNSYVYISNFLYVQNGSYHTTHQPCRGLRIQHPSVILPGFPEKEYPACEQEPVLLQAKEPSAQDQLS